MRSGLGLASSETRQVTGCCKHGDEVFGYQKSWKIILPTVLLSASEAPYNFLYT